MRSFWKIAVLVLCIAVAAVGWQAYKIQLHERKLADEASKCRVQAEHGDATAQFNLGSMYLYGKGVPLDSAEAVRWYRKAADQGDAEAKHALGRAYSEGLGVPQNYAEALRWFREGAEQGNAKAEYDLGYMYFHGTGVSQDYAEALLWFGKAAEQGEARAQYAIGSIHLDGLGVPQDYNEAMGWFRQAADQGDAKAQYAIGFLYDNGKGVPRNRAEAVRWFRKAADQGNEHAVHALSAQLSAPRKFALVVQFFGSVLLLIDFPWWGFITRGKTGRDLQQKRLLATGVLGFFSVGLDWYGYATYKIRRVGCGFTGFTVVHWLLSAVWLALLVSIVFYGRRFRMQQDRGVATERDNIVESSN